MSARRADALATAAVVALSVVIVFTSHSLGDYQSPGTADNAAPAIRDLLAGDLHGFLADQPLMGSLSILLRLPFAGVASLLGGGATLTYQLGALPCVVAPGLVGVLLARRMRAGGRSPAACSLTIALCLLNPATFGALHAGHPEELLAGALAVAALLVAHDGGRPGLVGALAGMAIATKQWTLLALPPIVLAAPTSGLRLVAATAAAAAVLVLPAPLASPQPFLHAARSVGGTHGVYPASVWWPLASDRRIVISDGVVRRTATVHRLPLGLSRSGASGLIVLAGAALIAAFLIQRRRGHPTDALGLLVLLMLVRCALDPIPLDYYWAPLFLALAAWEGLTRPGLPVGTLLAAGGVLVLLSPSPLLPGSTATNALSLILTAILGWYVGRGALGAWRAKAPARRDVAKTATSAASPLET